MAEMNTAEKIRLIIRRRNMILGAVADQTGQTRQNFSNKINNGFFILPSSRHEVILISGYEKDANELKTIVRVINMTEISQDDFLSNNIYYYSMETQKIIIQ